MPLVWAQNRRRSIRGILLESPDHGDGDGPLRTLAMTYHRCGAARQTGLSLRVRNLVQIELADRGLCYRWFLL